jgi:RimJ/RimL family protein N-acetyltransferase
MMNDVSPTPWPEDSPEHFLPTKRQQHHFGDFVEWSEGCGDDGQWLGSCPIHDPDRKGTSATFAFDRGIMRCQADPSCHAPKRAMSLSNVLKVLAER